MRRTPIKLNAADFPAPLWPILQNAAAYDSSCSRGARVIFLDRGGGYYLKSAPKGALEKEAAMTRYFHEKGLAAEVLDYISDEKDWLLTARVPGEDCVDAKYLAEPERLAALLGERLRRLHETDCAGCPVPDRTADYFKAVEKGFREGRFCDLRYPDERGFSSPEEAFKTAMDGQKLLKADTLIHGDYCLPNVMLDNWRFSGFIDLDGGGVGDRHIDIFWGLWSLKYNLKTDRYGPCFLDAYGRDKIDAEALRTVSACEVFG